MSKSKKIYTDGKGRYRRERQEKSLRNEVFLAGGAENYLSAEAMRANERRAERASEARRARRSREYDD